MYIPNIFVLALQRYLQRMEYLDLHDNYLEDIENLESLSYLTHLDVSINKIKHLSDLHLRLGNIQAIIYPIPFTNVVEIF